MKLKDNKGFILVTTVIMFMVIIVFASFAIKFMLAESKQAINHQNRGQAYYIARGGAEAVAASISQMNNDEIQDLESRLSAGSVNINEIDISGDKANVTISKDNEDLLITSVGRMANGVENIAVKVMEKQEHENRLNIKHAIFANGNVTLNHNDSEVIGDVSTNGFLVNNNKGRITGKLYENQQIAYEEFNFREIPINKSTQNLSLVNEDTISLNTSFNSLKLENGAILRIDATGNDVTLNIREFVMGNNSKVKVVGNNKVTIYVERINWSNNSSLTYESNDEDTIVDIYHYGMNNIILENNINVKFNLYSKDKEVSLEIKNNGNVYGSLFINGNSVVVNNNAGLYGLLYMPNANIKIENNSNVYGAIIGKNVTLEKSTVKYDEKYLPETSGQSEKITQYKPGYFK